MSIPSLSTIIQLNEQLRAVSTGHRLSIDSDTEFGHICPVTATRDYYYRAVTVSPQRNWKVSSTISLTTGQSRAAPGDGAHSPVPPSPTVEAKGTAIVPLVRSLDVMGCSDCSKIKIGSAVGVWFRRKMCSDGCVLFIFI